VACFRRYLNKYINAEEREGRFGEKMTGKTYKRNVEDIRQNKYKVIRDKKKKRKKERKTGTSFHERPNMCMH
jgi:hypothetical protein